MQEFQTDVLGSSRFENAKDGYIKGRLEDRLRVLACNSHSNAGGPACFFLVLISAGCPIPFIKLQWIIN